MARKRPPMTDAQKEAIAEGRRQHTVIRKYLTALREASGPGRRARPETIQKRLERIVTQLEAETDPAKEVELLSRKYELEAALAQSSDGEAVEELEEEFVKVVAAYSQRKGITRRAWREVGVPASVLKRAGVK